MDLYSGVVDAAIDHDEEIVDKEEGGESNGNKLDASAASTSVDERVTRRAKRPSKYLVKHLNKEGSSSPNGQNGGAEGSAGLLNGVRTAKNLRRPRNGYGRGLPKKGIPPNICIFLNDIFSI